MPLLMQGHHLQAEFRIVGEEPQERGGKKPVEGGGAGVMLGREEGREMLVGMYKQNQSNKQTKNPKTQTINFIKIKNTKSRCITENGQTVNHTGMKRAPVP